MNLFIRKQNKAYVSLKLGRKKTAKFAILCSLLILNLNVSCSYYAVKKVPTTKETITKQIHDFNQSEKYVIIHSDSISWHLSNMVINDDEQTITGNALPISAQHQYKRARDSKRVHRYNKSKAEPLNEVHFFLVEPMAYESNAAINIPLSNIKSISVNDRSTGRSIANVALTTVGVLFVAVLIMVATKSSCPFVYVKNGEEFDFVGELYPGVITPKMQKDDYLPLPNLQPENAAYILKISNLLKEVQYTDQLQLITVNHDKNIEVLMDSKGQFQSFQYLKAPIKGTLDNGSNNIKAALKKDNDFYAFNTPKSTQNSTRNMVLEFEKPQKGTEAKLMLRAKNSVWLDYVFGRFNEQFGSYYNTFQKDQQKVDAKVIADWSNKQDIPLSIYLKTNKGWQLLERVNTVGPLAMRDIVVPFNFDEHSGTHLQIKLETGFMFWEVDYVGIDFSKNVDLDIDHISPSKATDQNGVDVTRLLLEADKNYLVQPHIGDEVVVVFPNKKVTIEKKQSVFLKNRGFYNYVRDYQGVPDLEKLKSFKEEHAFTKYSESAYFEFVNMNLNELAQHE